ncbi:hypothetical protein COU60_05195 [Candidatus Pacearchaeota archaeon CG10_big_fil_rev_8_21_14_0_10_34_76]|nr:MAG: hypothetical protein COU60_05195 [Candidatus Pacearchaeota archaeon CG10_big_fil_rev_8_21_14_0_10_34_76]
MEKIEIIVDVKGKELSIDGRPMKLEKTLSRAYVDPLGENEKALNLEYRGNFGEDSPIETEMDKLRKTYGENISERIGISGNPTRKAHYLTFYGNINPTIRK